MKNRRIAAHQLRYEAADIAYNRPHAYQRSNGEENRYRLGAAANFPSYIGSFTKGFEHDADGFLVNPQDDDYQFFIRACDMGDLTSIQALNLNKNTAWKSQIALAAVAKVRGWESMGAGLTYDLEGPDDVAHHSARAYPRQRRTHCRDGRTLLDGPAPRCAVYPIHRQCRG